MSFSKSKNFSGLCLASTVALAALASMESAEGFSSVARTQQRANPLKMASSAQDEIAKLKAQAAKAREDAARLAKVRMRNVWWNLYFCGGKISSMRWYFLNNVLSVLYFLKKYVAVRFDF